MSLVRDLIEADSMATLTSLLSELPRLVEDSENLSELTLAYIDDAFIKFNRVSPCDYLQDAQKLVAKAEDMHSKVLFVKSNQIDSTTNEIHKCKEMLEKVDEHLSVCHALNRCHEIIRKFHKCIETKSYKEAPDLLDELKAIETSKCAKIMDVLVAEALQKRLELINMMEQEITNNMQSISTTAGEVITSKITFTMQQNANMPELLIALYECNENLTPLNTFATFLTQIICNDIPNNASLQLTDNTLKLERKIVKQAQDDEDWDFRGSFANLTSLAEFVYRNMCFKLSENIENAMDYIRIQCGDLPQMLIKHYLERTIPSSESELRSYVEVHTEVEILQKALIQYKLLASNSTDLTDYTSEMSTTHFAHKKCNNFMADAHVLITKDLSDIIIVGTEHNSDGLTCVDFAQCAISASVLDLLQLVEMILNNAENCANSSSGYYVATATRILDEYHDAVAAYHERLLLTIPKQTAIFYNNCRYIAHHISNPEWQPMIGRLKAILTDFVGIEPIAQRINAAAQQMLERNVREQVATIKQRVHEIRLHVTMEKLDNEFEKKIRQCLRHMELLKTMWHKVLNYFDYNTSIGRLLNVLSTDVIGELLRIDNMPANVVDQLVDVLKVIVARGPKLFTDPNEIRMYAQEWDKLSELIFVLTSRLVFIADRWAEGKGPLALHFTVDEMRKLIRALFQNSDLRADVLRRIH